jgi:RNA polymerase sigma-70 factor (ECF subfamily)
MEVTDYSYGQGQTQSMDTKRYFNRVYDDTYHEILKYVIIKTSRADQVDDIMQNIYSNFYTRILKRGYSDIRMPEAFIIKLTEKELARHYKRMAERKGLETELDDTTMQPEADEMPFAELMEDKEALEAVRRIVARLPLLSFKAFALFYYYDMTISSVAAQLEISEQNVKTRLWRARNAVRKELKGNSHDESGTSIL